MFVEPGGRMKGRQKTRKEVLISHIERVWFAVDAVALRVCASHFHRERDTEITK